VPPADARDEVSGGRHLDSRSRERNDDGRGIPG
jgi:hypothetical protein